VAEGVKPGRPRKRPALKYVIGMADILTPSQIKDMKRHLLNIQKALELSSDDQSLLCNYIAEKLPFYSASAQSYSETPNHKSGPRKKYHRAHLLIDCALAWQAVTGERPTFWVTPGDQKPSISVELARAVIGIVSRDCLSLSARF
jgi:cob(I)alamin adenosyltransferase